MIRRLPMLLISAGFGILLSSAACGSDSPAPPYNAAQGEGGDTGYLPGQVDVVVVDGTSWVVSGDTSGTDCVKLDGQCVDIDQLKRDRCGDAKAQADIVVVNGNVVDVICYPPKDKGTSVEDAVVGKDGKLEVPQNKGGTVVVFPEATDGTPLKGDLNLEAERIVLIGNGVDKTIIDGNLKLASNNSQVRGVTINGNVSIEKNSNNNSIAFCKIKGDLEISGNDATIVACDVFGNVKVHGNGVSLINVRIGGKLEVDRPTTCSDVYAFDDANKDFIIAKDELGQKLSCKTK